MEMFTFEIYVFHSVDCFSELCKFRNFQKKILIFLYDHAVNSEILHFFLRKSERFVHYNLITLDLICI